MNYDSILIRKLSILEISNLTEELETNSNLWTYHATDLNLTSLKEGKSIHIQWCDDELRVVTDNWGYFPKTQQLLKNIVGDNALGRVYWHRLLPGDKIDAHTDADISFVKSGELLHRYQIYLDVNKNVSIIFKNQIIDGTIISNSIIDFPLKSIHYYKNNSNVTLYLLVFDDIGTPSRIRTSECRNQNPMP